MNVLTTPLPGVLILEPRVFEDDRGFFMETFHQTKYREAGAAMEVVQTNLSFSRQGTLRGLHFQIRHPQDKLVQVITGEIFDVAVDIRPGSATFGQWTSATLSEANRRQLLVPKGFAHGFCVLSETAHVFYKCSDVYHPEDEGGILWSDPDLSIAWPVETPGLSGKDAALPRLAGLGPERLYHPAAD